MIRLANVIVAHADKNASEGVLARLSHNGYHAMHASTREQVMQLARFEHPDLILVGDVGEDAVALGAALKQEPGLADIPIVLLVETVSAAVAEKAYASGLDDTVSWKYDDVELLSRLRPLVRLATMHAELRHRAFAAQPFGLAARERAGVPEGARPNILVVGHDRDGVGAVLGSAADVVTSANLYDAESLLEQRNFDAAVVTTDGDIEGYLAFTSQVRNNPRLFNLPMVVLVDKGVSPADIYRRGASRVLSRPMDSGILRASVLSMVRRQQLRWSIRGALFDSLSDKTRDPLTGVYSRAFLDKYLGERLEIAKTHDRHLAVVFFYIPNIEGVRSHFGDDAAEHLAQQLGQWITGLLRAEDLTALYAANQFCVVLPDTPTVEAEVVMHRIAGVLAYTDFAVREVYQPIKVWVQVACTDAKSDDTLEALLARVQAKLD
ncbi:MAG: diguanylate cyclase [Magnetospirillum sp.]|nr:diguanylate cyclase [Magnetospirillum sp.]